MSIWTEFKGSVRIHETSNFSLNKSFYEISDESKFQSHKQQNGTNNGFIIYTFNGSCCCDLEEFLETVDSWWGNFPNTSTHFEVEVTSGRLFR